MSLGSATALYGGCSPSAGGGDAGTDAAVCDPDSGDSVGCGCDPSTYKVNDCYTGPPGTNGKGICQTGKRSCNSDGTLTSCVGEVTPKAEICNYADDDCNGIVDDVPEIADAAVLANCTSPSCDPNFSDAAITCWGADLGICGAGTKSCTGTPKGGSPTGCNEFIHGGVPEVCNGWDDDCNGQIDDGLNKEGPCDVPLGSKWSTTDPDADLTNIGKVGNDASPATILGECIHGNLTCVASNCTAHYCADAGDRCFPSTPAVETCNGLDDNCNGVIDDHACAVPPYANAYYCCTYGIGYGYCSDTNYGGCVLAK